MITHTVDLPVGITVTTQSGGSETHRALTIRESNGGDQFAAEEQAPIDRKLAFTTAQAGLQVVSIGSLKGPFLLEEIRKWHKLDIDALVKAWGEVEKKSIESSKEAPPV